MADYISLVDITSKSIYDLGKATSAKHLLPYFAHIFHGQPVVIFGDETHGYLEDEYLSTRYGGEYEEVNVDYGKIDSNALDEVTMSYKEFSEIFEKIGGKVITNLEDYIRYKYTPNNQD